MHPFHITGRTSDAFQLLPEGIFAIDSESIHSFNASLKVVTCFIEWESNILVLRRAENKDYPMTWSIPGGKCEVNESYSKAILREIQEETQINLPLNIQLLSKFYIRSAKYKRDYVLVVFHTFLEKKPEVKINFLEHQASQWITKDNFCSLNLLPFQKQVFEMIYPKIILGSAL